MVRTRRRALSFGRPRTTRSRRSAAGGARRNVAVRLAAAGAVVVIGVSAAVGIATGHRLATPTGVAAGETLFVSSGCNTCHVFRAARATGKAGPDLDTAPLTVAQIITEITKGGDAIAGRPASSKVKVSMPAFGRRLTPVQIREIAAFVSSDRGKPPLPPAKTTTKPATTTPAATPQPPVAAPPPAAAATTTAPAAPAATPAPATDTADGCPQGETIPTSGNSDGDGDNVVGGGSDGDGCV